MKETMKCAKAVLKESLCDFTNKTYGYHISEELYHLRDNFCPSKRHYFCDTKCPLFLQYITKGLSCNKALERFPDDCRQLIIEGGINYVTDIN